MPFPEAPSLSEERLLGDVAPPAHLPDLCPRRLRLPENPNDLVFGEPLPHLQALQQKSYYGDSQVGWLQIADSCQLRKPGLLHSILPTYHLARTLRFRIICISEELTIIIC